MTEQWHTLSADAALAQFSVVRGRGLTDDRAVESRKQYGANEITRKRPWRLLNLVLGQLASPLVAILLIAAGITFFMLDDAPEALIIVIAVLINTIIGVVQEGRASRAFEALRKTVERRARVLRGGALREVAARELVPGDIVEIDAGMSIEVDARLIEAQRLKVNESALTGEWIGQEKSIHELPPHTPVADRDNMIYAGTLCETGRGRAVVIATGMHTELGKIAKLVSDTREPLTPFQEHIRDLARVIGVGAFLFSCFIFTLGVMRGESIDIMFLTAVALAVSAVPEGLPIAVTVILALGAERILKKGGLLKRLKSAETLGLTTVILTDKTGTLTEGKMEVSQVMPRKEGPRAKEDLLLAGVLTSTAFIENPEAQLTEWKIRGEATDAALLKAGIGSGINKEEFEKTHVKVDTLPFDTELRFAAAIYEKNDEYIVFMTGAPEAVLARSHMSEDERDELEALYMKAAETGARLVACARKHIRGHVSPNVDQFVSMEFLGFLGMHDPLRKDAKAALHLAEAAGVRPVIVTGDHQLTAQRAAHELEFDGNPEHIALGQAAEDGKVDIEHIDIFARVLPHQKSFIAEQWQKRGAVVAMTGDGVNDAPALRRADIGIALGSGTDVAKEAADLVLINDSFSTIVGAIEEGRTIIDNIRKVMTFLLATAFTEIILIGGAFVLGLPLPLLPAQILWMNLVGEGFFNFAFAFEKREKDVLTLRPQERGAFFTPEMKALVFIVGISADLLLLSVFIKLLGAGVPLDTVRTVMFYGLAINAFFFVFSIRSLRRPIWKINFFSNPYLLLAFGASMLLLLPTLFIEPLQNLLHLEHLQPVYFLALLFLGFIDLCIIELVKYIFIVRRLHESKVAVLQS
ncbi:MAG: cation-transporting P-type ATPase [Patescibacteria group bacterium]